MNISIIPDAHCGYVFGNERGEDSFLALGEAIDKSRDSDLIIMVGDLFDTRIPKQEIFAKTAKILSSVKNIPCNTKFVDVIGKSKTEIVPSSLNGIPIVSLHGNHDRRSKHLINPVQALEHAGLLIHLHCSTIIFEINGERVAIHGMSNVPERYAKDCLNSWKPFPIKNAINILVLHQSIDPYIYSPLEPPSIKLEDLPSGFDLIIDGHMHWHDQRPLSGTQLLITGSMIPVSIHKKESEQKKGFYTYDGKLPTFKSLENQRRIYWLDFHYTENLLYDIREKIDKILKQEQGKMKPIIAVKIKGILPKDKILPNLSEIEEAYGKKAIINIKRKLITEELEEQIGLMRKLSRTKLSPEEQGLKILQSNLDQMNCGIDVNEIFDLLIEGNVNMIHNLLMEGMKTAAQQLEEREKLRASHKTSPNK